MGASRGFRCRWLRLALLGTIQSADDAMSQRFNPYAPDWHKQADIPDGIGLDEYAAAWVDMAPHVETLRHLASQCLIVVEFGLRGAVSTWAMLDGLPAHGELYGVDINPDVPLPKRVRDDPRFHFVVGDSLAVELPGAAGLVMIDSSHEFTQTVKELDRAAELQPWWIVCHDYLYQHTPQVKMAVDGFTMAGYLSDPPYQLGHVEASKWGLAILTRRE